MRENLRENVGRYVGESSRVYGDMEHAIMQRLNAQNRQRFRLSATLVILGTTWVAAVWGKDIRRFFTRQTADIARETLEDKSLRIQTQELATAVVQTVLNDQEVLAKAAAFLKEASYAPETQAALLQLTLHVLQHPDSIKQCVELVKDVVKELAHDDETIQELGTLFAQAFYDQGLKRAVVDVLGELTKDPQVIEAFTDLTVRVLAEPRVQAATNKLLAESGAELLNDEEVLAQSREFVTQVVGDDTIQRTGGTALWNTVTYSLMPAVWRIVGFGVLCGSIAIVRIINAH